MAARAGTGTSRVSTAKISIGSGSGLFGDIGGKAFTTPTFKEGPPIDDEDSPPDEVQSA